MGKTNTIVLKQFTKLPFRQDTKLQSYRCNHCGTQYAEHITRMQKHLIENCKKCPDDVKQDITFLISNTLKRPYSKISNADVESEVTSSPDQENDLTKSNEIVVASNETPRVINKINKYFDQMNADEVKECQKLLAKAVYASGTPLQLTENPYWQEFFTKLRPCFKLPSRYQLSTSLLDLTYEDIKNIVTEKISKADSIGLQCDGWSNIRNEGITNFIVTTPDPVFFKSVESEANKQTAQYVAEQISNVIEDIGVKKVLGVCTDNENKMTAAWSILEDKYANDSIHFYGCLAHVLHLYAKDILDQENSQKIMKVAVSIVKEIKYSHVNSAILKDIRKKKSK